MKKILSLLLVLALLLSLAGCALTDGLITLPGDTQDTSSAPTSSVTDPTDPTPPASTEPEDEPGVIEGEFYYSKEDVALYIHLYGRLPRNFVTKSEAIKQFGSNNKAMLAGYRIGGDTFQNREGLLPKKSGRQYYESDIVAEGHTSRGACRIVFSNDGLVYYTDDHYASFELLYGEP